MRLTIIFILLSFGLVQVANSAFEKQLSEPNKEKASLIEEGSLKRFILSDDISKLSEKELNKAREQLAIAISACKIHSEKKKNKDETCKALWNAVHL